MSGISWPVVAALASSSLNGVIGVLAYLRSGGKSVYNSLAMMSLSFCLWSLAYVRVWPEFTDPFWMKVLFSPLAWLPGASLSFVWSFTEMPAERRRLRTVPLYLAGFLSLGLMWAGRITLSQYRAAFILGGLPVFAAALALLGFHWFKAEVPAERNRRGYYFVAASIAVVGGFTDFLPSLGVPFLSLANVSLVAYSLIVLTAIERHHLLDLRQAAGLAALLISVSALLALVLTALASFTRQFEGPLFLNFFLLSLLLAWSLPPLWQRLNAAVTRLFFAQQAAAESALEKLERELEGACDLAGIEAAASGAVRAVWGAGAAVLWHGPSLRSIESLRPLPPLFEKFFEGEVKAVTVPGLRRDNSEAARELAGELDTLGMRAAAPVRVEGALLGVLVFEPPGSGFFDLSAVRWMRRLGQSLGRAARAVDLSQKLLHTDRLAQMGILAAGIAHEVRNPLSAMSGAAEMLSMKGAEGDREAYLEILRNEIIRLDGLLTELLDYASPRSREAACEWSEVWRRVEGLLKTGMPPFLSVRTEGEPASLAVSGPHLQQILINLVKNAVRAAVSRVGGADGRGAEVRVSVADRNGAALITVADNGPGIAEEVLPRLFTPFASESPGGTGLGLATVRRLAELYGGRAWAENAPGDRGARFLVELPRSRKSDIRF